MPYLNWLENSIIRGISQLVEVAKLNFLNTYDRGFQPKIFKCPFNCFSFYTNYWESVNFTRKHEECLSFLKLILIYWIILKILLTFGVFEFLMVYWMW